MTFALAPARSQSKPIFSSGIIIIIYSLYFYEADCYKGYLFRYVTISLL